MMVQESQLNICQLCFGEIPIDQKEKHLRDFHKVVEKAINKKEPLSRWFKQKKAEQSEKKQLFWFW